MEGRISWEEFLAFSSQLLDISNTLADGWVMQGTKENAGGAYLVKMESSVVVAEPECALENLEEHTLETWLEDKSAAVSPTSASGVLKSEYHILYSLSYEVPVLYFNVWKSDGSLLSLEEIWNRVPPTHQEAVNFIKWNTLTQQEHPILGKPFFQLHPCRTAELLSNLPPSGNRLLGWLSAVAPAAGLDLPLAYASLQPTV